MTRPDSAPAASTRASTGASTPAGASASSPRAGGILSGLKVLDVAHAYSAALTAALLADLGA